MTTGQEAVVALEVLLHLAGAGLFLWLLVSKRGRALQESVLPEWRIPGIEFAIFLFLGLAGASLMSSAVGLAVPRFHLSADASTVVASASSEGGILLGLLAFLTLYPDREQDRAAGPAPRFMLVSGLVTFLVSLPFVTVINLSWGQFLSRMGLPQEQQELVSLLENTHSAALRWSFVAVAAILVPVAEELLFRAGLFRYLRTRMPRWAAVATTSVLFGALHVQWSDHMGGLPSLLPLIVLAVVFCLAYERTGTVATPIVAHALFNLNMMMFAIAGVGQ